MVKENKKEEQKVLKGKSLWNNLKGAKDEIKEIVPINFNGCKGEITVIFRDIDMIQDIYEEYSKKIPSKPKVEVKVSGEKVTLEVPNEDEKYKIFNDKPEAKKLIEEWEKECKPIDKERNYRLAYEFMKENERPSDDPDEGVEILDDALPYADCLEIIKVGNKINNFSKKLEDSTKNS
jgi:hypothetical protein